MKQKPRDEQIAFLRTIVETCVRGIAEHEEEVRITTTASPQSVIFSIFVAPSDTGLVLGKEGATLDAIRRVVWTACKKTSYHCQMDLITGGGR